MKKIDNTILIAKEIARVVSSRDLVYNIKKEIERKKTKDIYLDFLNVEFISRSAAHEFILLQNELKNKLFSKKYINFVNVNDSVREMLRMVAANIVMPNKNKPILNLERTDIQTLIKNI
jgi:anti-anti-sigma regulatory factor